MEATNKEGTGTMTTDTTYINPEATTTVYNALKVLALDPKLCRAINDLDPMAFNQMMSAIAIAEHAPIVTIEALATYEAYDEDMAWHLSVDFRVTNDDANYIMAEEVVNNYDGDGIFVDPELSNFYAYAEDEDALEALISFLVTTVSDKGHVLAISREY